MPSETGGAQVQVAQCEPKEISSGGLGDRLQTVSGAREEENGGCYKMEGKTQLWTCVRISRGLNHHMQPNYQFWFLAFL